MGDLLTKLFFGGFVRLYILYRAAREPVFGLEMMGELARHGYDVGPGTIYEILYQLARAGFLIRHTRLVGGKRRKYYRATPEGIAALYEARARLGELIEEVLHDDPPTPSLRPTDAPPPPEPTTP